MSDSTDERLISPKAKRGRNCENENEDNKDRLSDLPDGVLLHILSSLRAKYAVQTCVLSTRWKNLWKRLPTLRLHLGDFEGDSKFVSRLLALLDDSVALDNVDIDHILSIKPHVIKRIVTYACSRNVQQLRLHANFYMHGLLPCIFTCKTLTSLKLEVLPNACRKERKLFPESLSLPALTTLDLSNFTFCSSNPFSGFNKLDSLIIENCDLKDAGTFCISSATLVNLTVRCLMNICGLELSTPCLHSFSCKGYPDHYFCGSGLSSIKEVYIDTLMIVYEPERPLVLLSWLQDFVNMTSLTVTTNTLQVLFLVPDLLKIKLPSLANLKRFKIKREPLFDLMKRVLADMVHREMEVTKSLKNAARLLETWKEQTAPLPDDLMLFLNQNSPSAKVKIIDCSM